MHHIEEEMTMNYEGENVSIPSITTKEKEKRKGKQKKDQTYTL
jgi:hypothetical protein